VIEDLVKLTLGAEMTVILPPTDKYGLDEFKIREYLAQVKEKDPTLIKTFSFTTYGMNDFPQMPRKMYRIRNYF
jgi:hypothetical protein